ncbi:MAG: uroporphyrinogen decarboxylase family protein [Clostridia bacterium]|nr:uroporphyrinogen decarboxylase family protein [Clostridia bacterium]
MNMKSWLQSAAALHKPMPILSFPGIQLINATVRELAASATKQAACMKAVADRWDTLASVSLMDLSVEAEAFGSPVRFSDDEVPTVTAPIVTDADSAERLAVPQVGAGRTGECVSTIREAKRFITDRPVLAGAIGPFSLSGRLMDMTEIMALCYEEPELVHQTLEKATQFLIAYNLALHQAGADGILMAEPAAGLLSPGLIAEFSTPYVKRIIGAVESEACIVIYHNCGNTIPLVQSILDTGASAFHFGNAIDLAQMLPLIPGDKVVFGNVDPAGQFRGGTPESMRQATLDVLGKCAKNDNFILSSGCDIPPLAPLANIDAFFDTAREFYQG